MTITAARTEQMMFTRKVKVSCDRGIIVSGMPAFQTIDIFYHIFCNDSGLLPEVFSNCCQRSTAGVVAVCQDQHTAGLMYQL